jgi:nitroreductase
MNTELKPVAPETVLAQLNWRYATKKFDPHKKISEADWKVLEQVLILSPSSFGLQPWKFLVVTNPAIKEKLVSVSWGQDQPSGCSHLVVFTVRQELSSEDIDRYVDRIAEVRGVPKASLATYREMMAGAQQQMTSAGLINHWATRQVYIALGNFMTCAALLGIDTCPMEGFDPAAYDKILGLEGTGYASVALCPAGYRAADDRYSTTPKVRFKPEDVIRHVK